MQIRCHERRCDRITRGSRTVNDTETLGIAHLNLAMAAHGILKDVTWAGEALIEPGRLVFRGRIGSAHKHAHAALQIVTLTDGAVSLSDADGQRLSASAAVIAAGAAHSIDTGTGSGVMVYLEPTSVVGRQVTRLFGSTIRPDVHEWVRLGAGILNIDARQPLSSAADDVIARLVGPKEQASGALHPSVEAVVGMLPDMLSGPVKLTDVAKAVHLSADRLGRLMAQEVGMSFPAYVRWSRLIRAMAVARDGGTITDAAHAAGFSDSSHANRAFHEMFGLAPIDARRGVRLT